VKIWFATVSLILTGCTIQAPAIIDRHTVLEDEAAGEWPQFEKSVRSAARERGQVFFPKAPASAHKQRLYNILGGDLVEAGK